VRVKGNTDLVGAVIASTQKAVDDGKNVFKTARLTNRDLENREDYEASGFSLSGGYSAGGTGKASDGSPPGSVSGQGIVPNQAGGINGASAGIGSASGHQSSRTTSGVSGIAGNTAVRTGDGSNGLVKTFDADKVQKDIAAQVQITNTFRQQAGKAIAEYANAKYRELKDTDPAEAAKWAEGGAYRVAAHAVAAGLTGGLQGALGAATSQLAVDIIGKQIAATDLPLSLKTALIAAAGTAIGAAVGGEAGAAAGFNATANNYLSTADLRNRRQAVADCNGNSACVAAVQRVSQETTLANNAKVLDACMGSGGDCSGAITKAQQDRSDLQVYRDALVDQQGEATDPASRAAIANQIKQADAQIRSADTAIADGKLIQAGGNYSLAGLTAEERVAIGFALDSLGAAGIKGGVKTAAGIRNAADNAVFAEEQNALIKKDRIAKNQQADDSSQFDHFREPGSTRPGGAWDWQNNAPNNGAVPGTTVQYPVKVGDVLDRFGSSLGTYFAPVGTPYGQRALAPGSQINEYHRYEVVKPINVERSEVAPAFNRPGGGHQIQYFIPEVARGPARVLDLIKYGYLKVK